MQLFFRIPVANENFYLMKINICLCLYIKFVVIMYKGLCEVFLIFYESFSIHHSPEDIPMTISYLLRYSFIDEN